MTAKEIANRYTVTSCGYKTNDWLQKEIEEYAILFTIEQLKEFKDQFFVNQENPIGGIIADKIKELKNQLTTP